jgi:hypothetical protein
MGETRGTHNGEEKRKQVLVRVGKPTGCRTLNRAWDRQEDNTEMDSLPF